MIITRNEVKTFLQILDTEKDSLIDMLIPIIEQTVCDYCNDDFVDRNFDWFSNSAISFLSSDNSINMIGIENYKLFENDSIRIYNSLRNNQSFTIDSITTNKIIVNSIDNIKNENYGETVYLSRIDYPSPLKLTIAQMIGYDIEKITPGVKTEKIDDYSITFEDKAGGYPSSYMAKLSMYRQLYKKSLTNMLFDRTCI